MSHVHRQRELVILALTVVVAVVVRVVLWLQFQDTPFGPRAIEDEAFYDAWARALMADGPAADPPVYHMMPFPSRWLAFWYRWVGTDPGAIRAVHAVIGVLNLLIGWRVTRLAFGPTAGLVAAAGFAVAAPLLFYETSLLPLVLSVTATLVGLHLLVRVSGAGVERGGAGSVVTALLSLVGAGLAMGLLVQLRGNALILVGFLAVGLAVRGRGIGGWSRGLSRVASVVAFLVGTVMVIAPVTLHNVRQGGEFVLLTWHGGQNLYIGNHTGASGLYRPLLPGRQAPDQEREDAIAIAEGETGRVMSPREIDRFWSDRARAFWREDPKEALALLVRKGFFFFSRYEFPDAHDFYYVAEVCPVLRWLPAYGFILPLAAFGLAVGWRRSGAWLWGGGLLAYVASVLLFFIFGRYRLPVLAFMIPLLGLGVSEIVRQVRARRWGPLMAPGVVALIALAISLKPAVPKSFGLASTWFNVGLIHEDAGEDASAATAYGNAIDYNTDHVKARRGFARAGLRSDVSPDSVLATMRPAIEIDPENAEGWALAGEALARLNRPRAARAAFRNALKLAPQYPAAVEGLARVSQGEGAPDPASTPAPEGEAGADTPRKE